MPTVTLLNNVSSDTSGTGSSVTGPCTVDIEGTFQGLVELYSSLDDVTYTLAYVTNDAKSLAVDRKGSYYLKADYTHGSGAVTVKATN